MRPPKIFAPLFLALALVLAGCGTSTTAGSAGATTSPSACPTANTTAFAKTKLVLHAGLAFGAFHRYLYKPYRAGSFTTGGTVHKATQIAKAGAAALFIERELRLAIGDVRANPTLCNDISKPLTELEATVTGALGRLKHGDTSGLTSADTSISSIQSSASGAGTPLPDAADPTIS